MVHIDVSWLTALLSLVLPALTALVTKRLASPAIKSVVLLLLTVIAAVIQQGVIDNGVFDIEEVVATALTQFVFAVAVHFGLLRPTRVTGPDGVIQSATPHLGLGSETRSDRHFAGDHPESGQSVTGHSIGDGSVTERRASGDAGHTRGGGQLPPA